MFDVILGVCHSLWLAKFETVFMCDHDPANQKFALRTWPQARLFADFNGIPNKCFNVKTECYEEAPEAWSRLQWF